MKLSLENPSSFEQEMDFLLHPSTTTWRLNFDCRKQVAEGARDGDLLCQAEMFSHLTLFANYEDPKNPRVSRIRAKWLENIKAQGSDSSRR